MRYEYNGRICTIAAQNYSLVIDTEKAIAGVVIGGAQFAKLDLRSAVNKLGGDLQPITDSEPEKPEFSGISEMPGQIVLVWKAKSALWDKQYSLICTPSRFRYRVGVSGEGRVDSVNYFSGDLSAGAHGSEYEFSEGFYPCAPWQPEDSYYFSPEKKYSRWNVLMIPPSSAMRSDARGYPTGLCSDLPQSAVSTISGGLITIPAEIRWTPRFISRPTRTVTQGSTAAGRRPR